MHEKIRADLLSGRSSYNRLIIPPGVGVYAYFLKATSQIPSVVPAEEGLLYVGMTEDGFEARSHFDRKNSGFSSPRRSLGALLKGQLDLIAEPRGAGVSDTNFRNYTFSGDGEKRLSIWMQANLEASMIPVQGNISTLEDELIADLKPPLNLKGWPNPQRNMIKELRAACVREARAKRAG